MTISSRFASLVGRFSQSARGFKDDKRGHVVVTFALTIVPILGFIGGAVDYTRANNARSAMQAALDSTSLMISKDAANLSQADLNTKAQAYFNAMFNHPEVVTPTIAATYTASSNIGSKVVVTGSSSMQTNFMKVVGMPTLAISTSSTAAWGNTRMRVALALDVTGSMAQDGKMDALKPAAKDLIDQLSKIAKANGDVYISIVPFSKDVNVGKSNKDATWLDWTDWDNVNGKCSDNDYKTKTKCEQKSKTWTVSSHSNWNGCVTDRDQNYDVQNTAPSASDYTTLFPPEQFSGCSAELMPLSYDWTALKAKIESFTPTGNTNQGIGLAWAWHSLSQTAPLNAPAEEANYKYNKVIILMSDGLNTENRWYTSASQIDAREALLCTNIKNAGITIYSIQVNTGGDPTQTVMKNCASGTDKFFILTSANQLATTFSEIGKALSKLRIAQ